MAVKGFITIEEDDVGSYSFIKKGSDETVLSGGERRIAKEFYDKQTFVAVKTHNQETIKKAINALKQNLSLEYEKIYFMTNSKYLIPGLVLSILILIGTVFLGRDKGLAAFMTAWLSGWKVACVFLVYQANKSWKKAFTTEESRIMNLLGAFFISLFAIPFLAGEGFGLWAFASATSPLAVLIILAVIFINILFYHFMKAPTIKGRAVMDQIEGLKLYLSVAEKDRLNMLNPPEKTPETFERFLPYALALDVEQAWCEQFAEVLDKARTELNYSPARYSGGYFGNLGAGGLASSLSSLSSTISSASAPGSSAGGGGSSGGGGGGVW